MAREAPLSHAVPPFSATLPTQSQEVGNVPLEGPLNRFLWGQGYGNDSVRYPIICSATRPLCDLYPALGEGVV